MAITLQCPRCMNKQKVDESKVGTEVPCKLCFHMLAVGGAMTKDGIKPKAAPDAPGQTGIKNAATAALSAKNPPAAEDEPRRTRRRRADEDDEDWDRQRRARSGGDSSVLIGLLIGGGVFVFLALLCGGASMWMLFGVAALEEQAPLVMAPGEEGELVVEAQPPPPVRPPRIRPAPPPLENLNANDPNAMGRVLELLRGPAPQRAPAFRWLAQADPNHPRRAELAKQLEAIVEQHRQGPPRNPDFFNAYFRWAAQENVPSLLRIVQADPQQRAQAMRTLGKLKDERAAEPLAQQLDNVIERKTAADSLKDLGPSAASAALKRFNHPDLFTRKLVRDLVAEFNTKPDAILTQCLADLDPRDGKRRSAALQWIAKCPVDPARKLEVSKALSGLIDEGKSMPNRDLMAALESWGTKENIPQLSRLARQGTFGNRDAVRILGKMRDPEATQAVALALANFFVAAEARKALKEIGSDAEPAVIDAMMKTKDVRALRNYASLLGEIGTPARSLPALAALQMRVPRDFVLNSQIQQSAKAIQARGQ